MKRRANPAWGRPWRPWAASVAAAWLLASPRPARAAPPAPPPLPTAPLELEWVSDDESCQGAEPVSREVSRLLASRTALVPLSARAEVERAGGRWTVRLHTTSGTHAGQRTLQGESCEEVRRAIALLLAMTLEAEAAEAAERAGPTDSAVPAAEPAVAPTAPADEPTSEPGPARPPPLDAGAAPATDAPRSFGFHARAHAAGATGLLPGAALGVGASVGAWAGPLSVLVGATYWPERRTSIPNGTGSVLLTGQTLELSACWALLEVGMLRTGPCVVPHWTWLRATATGIGDEGSHGRNGPGIEAGAEVEFSPVAAHWYFAVRPTVSWSRELPFHLTSPAGCEQAEAVPCRRIPVHGSQTLAPRLRAEVGMRF